MFWEIQVIRTAKDLPSTSILAGTPLVAMEDNNIPAIPAAIEQPLELGPVSIAKYR